MMNINKDELLLVGDNLVYTISRLCDEESFLTDIIETFNCILTESEIKNIYDKVTFVDLISSYPLAISIHTSSVEEIKDPSTKEFVNLVGDTVRRNTTRPTSRLYSSTLGTYRSSPEYVKRFVNRNSSYLKGEEVHIKEAFVKSYMISSIKDILLDGLKHEKYTSPLMGSAHPLTGIPDIVSELESYLGNYIQCIYRDINYIKDCSICIKTSKMSDSLRDYLKSVSSTEGAIKTLTK